MEKFDLKFIKSLAFKKYPLSPPVSKATAQSIFTDVNRLLKFSNLSIHSIGTPQKGRALRLTCGEIQTSVFYFDNVYTCRSLIERDLPLTASNIPSRNRHPWLLLNSCILFKKS